MQIKRRWMASMIEQSAKTDVQMPWARGARRAAMIARRSAAEAKPARSARA